LDNKRFILTGQNPQKIDKDRPLSCHTSCQKWRLFADFHLLLFRLAFISHGPIDSSILLFRQPLVYRIPALESPNHGGWTLRKSAVTQASWPHFTIMRVIHNRSVGQSFPSLISQAHTHHALNPRHAEVVHPLKLKSHEDKLGSKFASGGHKRKVKFENFFHKLITIN